MEARIDAAVVDWAERIPVDQIPSLLAFLTARLLEETGDDHHSKRSGVVAPESDKYLKAGELADRLGVPESWVRTEERAARIPSVRLGKYVRFRLSDVERELAERKSEKV